ncbi:DUF4244 domain-containing protein [[Actinomadura] parvosata]|uniref:DUF4244 domain-containing protein n=1 Tax=[Actinomadura] parvosata TaxID=1955412 RepID=UPI001E4AB171|nr:DUF4244 domain-containing protein [Nonomuraea sp. ATCC 55076]
MHSPAITPDDIAAAPASNPAADSAARSASEPTTDQALNAAATKTSILAAATTLNSAVNQALNRTTTDSPLNSAVGRSIPSAVIDRRRISSPRPRTHKWLHYAASHRERGMSTAEYAVGTIAACAFAALLFKVVNSPEVLEMLTSLISRALNTGQG